MPFQRPVKPHDEVVSARFPDVSWGVTYLAEGEELKIGPMWVRIPPPAPTCLARPVGPALGATCWSGTLGIRTSGPKTWPNTSPCHSASPTSTGRLPTTTTIPRKIEGDMADGRRIEAGIERARDSHFKSGSGGSGRRPNLHGQPADVSARGAAVEALQPEALKPGMDRLGQVALGTALIPEGGSQQGAGLLLHGSPVLGGPDAQAGLGLDAITACMYAMRSSSSTQGRSTGARYNRTRLRAISSVRSASTSFLSWPATAAASSCWPSRR
jgi:hypothetical protein